MKAIVTHDFKGLDSIALEEIEKPTPKKGEVLLEIKAAGINPVDWKIAEGLLKSRMEYQLPVTLGWDCSGIIADPQDSSFQKGDRVYAYCRKELLHDGTFAEYIAVEADKVAYLPTKLSFEEGAVIPLSALTAWQCLVDHAKIQKGQTVLIHAGAGGVGSFAIQIAKHFGCYVITTASPKNHAYVTMLGADKVIDYTKEEVAVPADCILNTVSQEVLDKSYAQVNEGGHLVSIVGAINEKKTDKYKIVGHYVFVENIPGQLHEITELFEKGELSCPAIQASFPLERAEEALMQSRTGHVQGKLVLTL